MLQTSSIREVPGTPPGLFAFRIAGEVSRQDMAAMGERMSAVFEHSDDPVDMLLIFDHYEGAETFAGFSWPAIKSRTESLWSVNRYVTAKAPDAASAMVETMGKVIPPEAHAFDTEAEAWAFFGIAQPV